VIHTLEFISLLIFILSAGANPSETGKPGMIWCKGQNPCRVAVSEEEEDDDDEEEEEDTHSIAIYL
jgi:hypothetical protein